MIQDTLQKQSDFFTFISSKDTRTIFFLKEFCRNV